MTSEPRGNAVTTSESTFAEPVVAGPARTGAGRLRLRGTVPRGLAYLLFALLAIVEVLPYYWMLVRATHTDTEMVRWPPPLGLGNSVMVNYDYILSQFPMWRNFFNSILIATTHMALVIFFGSLVAYAFAFCRDAPGRKFLFGFCLATMMIPGSLNMVPYFTLMTKLGWLNNYLALIVPGAASPFAIFWLHQFMRYTVPLELLDAARIDGCSRFGTYWRVVLPIIPAGLATQAVLTFLGSWNDFFAPLLVLTDRQMYTYPLMIYTLRGHIIPAVSPSQLGVVIGTVPVLIVFVLASRSFMSGIMAGAVKA